MPGLGGCKRFDFDKNDRVGATVDCDQINLAQAIVLAFGDDQEPF